jgi:DNA-binding CsgD family transcriptional regulator/N-acetylneuraminic acid mutarotase
MTEYGEELTEREKELLQLVATGVTNREVAHRLSISVNTVKVHLRNVFTKLGVESRTEATMVAVREGWVVVEGAEEAPESSEFSTEQPQPLPPLPWFKRVALLATLPLIIAAVAMTQPSSQPQNSNGLSLPPDLETEQSSPQVPERGENEDSLWYERAQMPTRRAHLALAAINGHIFAIAGQTPEGITDAVEIYNPEEDLWTRGNGKPVPVAYVSADAIGTDVYVPGGCDTNNTATGKVEVYNTMTDSWSEVSPLPEPRCAYALATLNETLYLFGGWDGKQYVATTYIYDSQTDTWTQGAPMGTERGLAAASPLASQIYVVGGYDGKQELTTCAVYDPEADNGPGHSGWSTLRHRRRRTDQLSGL